MSRKRHPVSYPAHRKIYLEALLRMLYILNTGGEHKAKGARQTHEVHGFAVGPGIR